MAKIDKAKKVAKAKVDTTFPLERENFLILGVGLLFIILGYIALSGNTVEGFRQLTLAPTLLLLGYCVIIPIGIMYRKKPKADTSSKQISETPGN